jgi:hypothetical protein
MDRIENPGPKHHPTPLFGCEPAMPPDDAPKIISRGNDKASPMERRG